MSVFDRNAALLSPEKLRILTGISYMNTFQAFLLKYATEYISQRTRKMTHLKRGHKVISRVDIVAEGTYVWTIQCCHICRVATLYPKETHK
jgi:hypothetical protein